MWVWKKINGFGKKFRNSEKSSEFGKKFLGYMKGTRYAPCGARPPNCHTIQAFNVSTRLVPLLNCGIHIRFAC